MQLLNELEAEPLQMEEEEKRHTRRLLVGLLCALIIAGIVLGGYLFLRKRHERQLAAAAEVERQKKAPKVEVAVDDAMVNGKTTILGGTVHNISSESLHNVAVQLQLRKRVGSGVESRVVIPESTELAPDAKARYSIQVATQDYISATFLGVVAGDNRADIPFKAFPGAARPPMDVPPSKTIIVQKPRPKNGEEFINTPNTPGRVP